MIKSAPLPLGCNVQGAQALKLDMVHGNGLEVCTLNVRTLTATGAATLPDKELARLLALPGYRRSAGWALESYLPEIASFSGLVDRMVVPGSTASRLRLQIGCTPLYSAGSPSVTVFSWHALRTLTAFFP